MKIKSEPSTFQLEVLNIFFFINLLIVLILSFSNKPTKQKKKSQRGYKSNSTNFLPLGLLQWLPKGSSQKTFETILMAPPRPAAIRWCVLTVVLTVFLLIQPSISIYCDEDDCYDLLGYFKFLSRFHFSAWLSFYLFRRSNCQGFSICQCL